MEALLKPEVFQGFDADPWMPYPPDPPHRLGHSSTDGLRQLVRSQAPKRPGVYGMLDATGRLIYVGKSKSLRHRLLSYFLPNSEDEKAGRIIQATREITWENQPSEFAALLRELQLIRSFRPRFNVQGVPNRQRSVFLCLGRSPAETFYVAREPDPKALAWEGPLVGAGRVLRAVEVLNRYFQLRDCPNQTTFRFNEQRQLFELEVRAGCMRHELGTCLAPCAQVCSRKDYQRQVELARRFLRGEPIPVVEHLERQMRLAAGRLHFEQAARYREDAKIVRWIANRFADHAQAREQLTCVYPVAGCDGRDVWYLIRRGVVEHAVASPKETKRSREQIQRVVQRWYERDKTVGAPYHRREETLAIVSAWFRKYPQEQGKLKLMSEVVGQTADRQPSYPKTSPIAGSIPDPAEAWSSNCATQRLA